jgi:hypothetical protein
MPRDSSAEEAAVFYPERLLVERDLRAQNYAVIDAPEA